MIPGPVINGIQSYYGCPECGGSGGGGSPGVKGRGWIEVPDTPQQGNQPAEKSALQAQQEQANRAQARHDAEVAKAAAEARRLKQQQFEQDKQDALNSLKGISENELGLKGVDETKNSELGLKGVDDTKTLFDRGTRWSAPVDTRAKGHVETGTRTCRPACRNPWMLPFRTHRRANACAKDFKPFKRVTGKSRWHGFRMRSTRNRAIRVCNGWLTWRSSHSFIGQRSKRHRSGIIPHRCQPLNRQIKTLLSIPSAM